MSAPDPEFANSVMLAKLFGAIAGSAISLAYVLPHGRREAAIRFFSGVAGGMVFGTTVGVHIARELTIDEVLSDAETAIMGAGIASLTLWWGLGVVLRWSGRKTKNQEPDNER